MLRAVLAAFVALTGAGGLAADPGPVALRTGNDARGWEGVGRLEIAGKGFCTATLIAPGLVLTAAHCLFERDSGAPVAVDRLEFRAGWRDGRAGAYRGVRRAVTHPAYVADAGSETRVSRWDLALIELAQPIRSSEVRPFTIGHDVPVGTEVGVVSYARDRAEAPSLQQMCPVVAEDEGILVLSCEVDFGSSGAPVFRLADGVAEVVSVVSAKAELNGERVAVGMELAQPLAELRAALADTSFAATPPGAVRVIRPGERIETGARFVRAAE
ncbi:MAG: trypsin-like serine protease [Rubellimicrobium sp.]|nr:trypsin-like serine protease [Rubellimicrobium sp.]